MSNFVTIDLTRSKWN